MKTTRAGVDPDPIAVEVRMKVLAAEGLSARALGMLP